jgi:Putative auto-transporter adhesin, head GIN domain
MSNRVKIGFMGLAFLAAAGSVSFATAQGVATAGARLLEVDRYAGQVEIRTSSGGAFNIEIIPGAKMTAQVEREGTTLRIKGPLGPNVRSTCNSRGIGAGRVEQMIINGTRYEAGDLPRIIISGPDTMGLRIKRSLIRGSAGNVGGASIEHMGCGDFALGNVAQDLDANITGSGDFQSGNIGGRVEANLAGSGDVSLGNIGNVLTLNVAGSGDTKVGAVAGKSEVNLAGSGDVEIASVAGVVDVNIAGSGDVDLRAGRSRLSANVAGSGTIRHGGIAIDPEISIVGSGDVIVARLEGRPSVSKLGSGEFRMN